MHTCTIYIQCTRELSICQTEYCAPTELVQCRRLAHYRTRIGRVQYSINAFMFAFILENHAKSKLYNNIVANLWVIKQIINHNRSKFVLSKLVLTGVCCEHFMYTCMHCSCTLSCVHVECMSTSFVIRLLFNVFRLLFNNILLKYECKIFLFP